ncbi:DUF4232 domain-containing protein [Streptomyces sp. NBC_00059]|uniref:DUF4232 domain-containing protein n=1 Tax=Streptomyces sp. NBC_00059 TaxID=2975635 RepID=UPI00225AD317|nr:DUF4232 domain-containing protein [Streptomyces sp. NBC_00059]MCX5411838.1 DUF4232 domain-containing protein [Streptomyces sp. NBC_00059]
MRNLRFRRAARTSVLGTAALIAALSLTACQSDSPEPFDALDTASQQPADGNSAAPAANTDKEPAGDSGSTGSGSGTEKDSGSSGTKPAAKPAEQAGTSGSGNTGSGNTGSALPTCTGANTKLTMTSVTRPINHMLLTVTNTGSKACNAYYYPFLRFGEAQSVPRTVEDSKPQAVVTLTPGQSAYAGVMTASADGSGTGGYSTKDLSVSFQGAKEGASTGSEVSVPLGKEVYVDSTLAVTYWQTEMDDALMY